MKLTSIHFLILFGIIIGACGAYRGIMDTMEVIKQAQEQEDARLMEQRMEKMKKPPELGMATPSDLLNTINGEQR